MFSRFDRVKRYRVQVVLVGISQEVGRTPSQEVYPCDCWKLGGYGVHRGGTVFFCSYWTSTWLGVQQSDH